MTRALPILYIASRSDIAGGEVYLLDVFRHLDRSRFTPIVVVPGEGALKTRLDDLGIRCLVVKVDYGWLKPSTPWYQFLSGMPERVRRLIEIISSENIELVHTNSNMILDGMLAARLAGVRHVLVVHIPFQENLPIYQRAPIRPASFAELVGDFSSASLRLPNRWQQAFPHRYRGGRYALSTTAWSCKNMLTPLTVLMAQLEGNWESRWKRRSSLQLAGFIPIRGSSIS